jgi:uncharacterized protein DUF4352
MGKFAKVALITTAVGVVICGGGIALIGSALSGGGDKGGSSTSASAKIGEPARDAKFEFTVKEIKCGVPSVGSELLGEKAQGQFCLVTVNVKNIGEKPQTLFDSNQKAFSASGTEYAVDSAAGLYANKDQGVWVNEINPGNQVTGVFVFDVPKDAQLAKLELHDSAFSGGITVQLAS